MYRLAHFLRDRLPFLWNIIDRFNSLMFCKRYGRIMRVLPEIMMEYSKCLEIFKIQECETVEIERFFASQPEDSFKYFKPHGFDAKSLRKLQGNKAFLAYIVRENGNPVGYFFLRRIFLCRGFFRSLFRL